MNIKFKGQRIDNDSWVEGYYFKTPLTVENFGAGHLGDEIIRHCISNYDGVVFEVIPESITCNIKEGLERDINNLNNKIKESQNNAYCKLRLKTFKTKSKEILKRIEGN
jgi:hypothetical protein